MGGLNMFRTTAAGSKTGLRFQDGGGVDYVLAGRAWRASRRRYPLEI